MRVEISLRKRLIKSTLMVSLLVTVIGALGIGFVVSHSSNEIYDELIESNARALIGDANTLPDIGDEWRVLNEELDIEYQVFNSHGALLTKTHHAPTAPFLQSFDNNRYYNVYWQGRWWRLYVLFDDRLNRYVQIAQPWSQRLEHAWLGIVNYLALVVVFLIALVAAQLWAINSSLKPLQRLSEILAKKNLHELSAIAPEVQMQETAPLIAAINELFVRLSAAKTAQERFVADAAHELRTPLAAIAMKLQLTMRRHGGDAALDNALSDLRADVARATAVVESLLMLARLDCSDVDAKQTMRVLSVRTWLEDTLSVMATQANWQTAEPTIQIQVNDVKILGDATLLNVALRNVLDNALRYGKSKDGKARIRLKAWQTQAQVYVSVEDGGVGVSDDDRARLEERFFRVLGSGELGSGLGLSIVRKIIEHHDGTLKFTMGLEDHTFDTQGFGVVMAFRVCSD